MPTQVTVNLTPQGELYSVRDDHGRVHNVLISTQEINDIDAALELNSAIKSLTIKAENYATKFIGDEFNKRLWSEYTTTVRNPLRTYRTNATELKRKTEKELDDLAQVPAYDSYVEAHVRSDIRMILRGAEPGEAIKIINDADYRTLAAICEAPAIVSGWHPDIYQIARERLTFSNVIRKFGISADHKRQVTLDDLLAHGVDQSAAEATAKEVLKSWHRKIESAELAASSIRRTVSFIATLTEKQDQEILDDLLA